KGSITVLYGSDKFVLNTGESIYYDSVVEHLVISASDEPAQVLAVVYTPN
ncbi:MAG TPA: DNA-binding protein, partial [Porphyromonadaceae bacterium]|nr:DNA-binding protein [Porphyromonadaceae bacterium]HBC38785.1 DNA-binding protein [Porphyromonadaceae bacterium]HBF95200.1 DNA-binding protein [Porphyromonadaceae bacterium]HCA98834.1 DNA-binding protein [Porphyromonadaceae bacterium]HCB87867.1 DNA-binding protein [Porphyromonadaceae bacterium]